MLSWFNRQMQEKLAAKEREDERLSRLPPVQDRKRCRLCELRMPLSHLNGLCFDCFQDGIERERRGR